MTCTKGSQDQLHYHQAVTLFRYLLKEYHLIIVEFKSACVSDIAYVKGLTSSTWQVTCTLRRSAVCPSRAICAYAQICGVDRLAVRRVDLWGAHSPGYYAVSCPCIAGTGHLCTSVSCLCSAVFKADKSVTHGNIWATHPWRTSNCRLGRSDPEHRRTVQSCPSYRLVRRQDLC